MKPARHAACSLLLALLAGAPALLAQDQPLLAGADGVPVPKRTKHVQPNYPAEARSNGVRGIVILDLVIDETGHVRSASVIRSVPGLDEAAITAARQWMYEPVKVDGKAVSVRLTVPITFTLALPTLERDAGIPELRQGVMPVYPHGASGSGLATAAVSLESDGRIATARVVEGTDPWAGALLHALQTWRFTPPPEDAELSFRIEASFTPGHGSDPPHIGLKASGLQRTDLLGQPAANTPPPPPGSAQPATAAPGGEKPPAGGTPATPPPGAPQPPGTVPDAAPPSPQPPVPTGPGPAGTPLPAPRPEPQQPRRPGPTAAGPADRPTVPPRAPAEPPVEVITVPPPSLPPENGMSAIRDVTLEPGVPDLTRGRRPVTPPLARIAGATGTVAVAFSVSAAGTPAIQSVKGPDILKKAAEGAVSSWVFRRTRADRAYLTAVFSYGEDKAAAVVRPQPLPDSAAAPAPPAQTEVPSAATPAGPATPAAPAGPGEPKASPGEPKPATGSASKPPQQPPNGPTRPIPESPKS